MKNKKNNLNKPDLEIGKVYFIENESVIVKLADYSGCSNCAFRYGCARFVKKSKLSDFYKLCAGYYRADKQSVVFVELKRRK